MKKHFGVVAVLCVLALFVGCAGSGSKGLSLGGSPVVVDYQTDIPMLTYAFCTLKPETAAPLAKMCEVVRLTESRDELLVVLGVKLAEYSGPLLADDYTRKWVVAKAGSLLGLTIDPSNLNILKVDDAMDHTRMKEILLLVCEGAQAYQNK